MILSCKLLLDHNPKPNRQQIREAVAGNLCRCGTYPHVFDAVERAAGIKKAAVSEPLMLAGLSTAGLTLSDDPRVDAATREALEAEEA
jgi:xanthine dehydrogenase iron-sulfur cluster and FAD-binding subunit A